MADEEKICAICQGKLNENNESINELPCDKNHAFHSNCINDWIMIKKTENAECPICRKAIFKKSNVVIDILQEDQPVSNSECPVCEKFIRMLIILLILIGPLLLLMSFKYDVLWTYGLIFTGFFDGLFLILFLLYFISKNCRGRFIFC
jgi:hypothetical protein